MKEFKYKINGADYNVTVNKSENNTIELEVNGTPYVVEVEAPAKKTVAVKAPVAAAAPSAPAAQPVSAPRTSAGGGKNAVKSPLPGVILNVCCNEGDTVKKGQVVMILEAMKMENNVLANADGTVSKIIVRNGDSVLEGTDLMIIE